MVHKDQLRPQRLQNFHPPPGFSLVPLPFFPLLTHKKYTGIPATTNATTMMAWLGCANAALDRRNILTQQKMIGVKIQVL